MAKTRKPCPGCGRVPTLGRLSWRNANSVCDRCRRILDEADRTRDESDAKAQGEVLVYVDEPYIPHGDGRPKYGVGRRFTEVVMSVGKDVPRLGYESHRPLFRSADRSTRCGSARIPINFAAAIKRLWRDTEKALGAAYAQGHEDGQNLLAQLATGELTVQDFNERAQRARSR